VQTSLRTATEIYKKGGNVTMIYRDQLFRMHFDNRRVLKWKTTTPYSIEQLLDSNPLSTIEKGSNLRYISAMHKKKLYGKYTSVVKKVNKYDNKEEIAVRNFIKGLLTVPPLYNLPPNAFISSVEIINFIKAYNPELKYNAMNISRYKNRDVKLLKVIKSKETESFVNYVKAKFKDFDEKSFYIMNNR
jgi:hypothetical protein